jgi:hypothetical protein
VSPSIFRYGVTAQKWLDTETAKIAQASGSFRGCGAEGSKGKVVTHGPALDDRVVLVDGDLLGVTEV